MKHWIMNRYDFLIGLGAADTHVLNLFNAVQLLKLKIVYGDREAGRVALVELADANGRCRGLAPRYTIGWRF